MKCIEEEIPFELPEGWAWARLKNICMMASGKAKASNQIKSEQFDGCYPCFGGNGIRGYVDEYNQDGVFSIVGRQGALCGNVNIASGKFYATEHAVVTILFDGIDFNWSNYTLEALRLNEYAIGAAQPGLSVAKVLNVFVPVPPTQEQIYIGHKIAVSVKIIENITSEKEDLKTLISVVKSKILDLAIRGQLVPQNPDDEPASVLLERIRAEKEELIKQGKIKRDKKESIIFKGEDNSYYLNELCKIDLPFDIPDNWIWFSHNELYEISGGAQPPKSKFADNAKENYVRLYQIRDYGEHPVPVYIPQEYATKRTNKGDILLARYGASLGKVFWAEDGAYNVAMAKVESKFLDGILLEYMFYFYHSRIYKECIFTISRTAQSGFNKEDLNSLYIPLPPIEEQKRIVDAIKKIYYLIDNISNAIS